MRRLRKPLAAALAVLLVGAVVAPYVGLATAQSDTYSHQFTAVDDTRWVGFETEGWGAAEFTIEVSTDDGPGGEEVVLYRENHTTASVPDGGSKEVVMFENAGAYSNVTVTVTGAPEKPTWGTGVDYAYNAWDAEESLASTGGDRDLICDTMESLSTSLNPNVEIVDCGALPGTTSVNETALDSLDANETKLEIYQSAAASGDSAENVHAIMNNQLQDAETVALIKGKNAYIGELNEDGSKTASKAAATENISEYYARHEMNIISQWNSQMSTFQYLRSLSQDESGVSASYIGFDHDEPSNQYTTLDSIENVTFGTESYTLVNGTTVDVTTFTAEYHFTFDGTPKTQTATVSVTDGDYYVDYDDSGIRQEPDQQGRGINVTAIKVAPPTDSYDETQMVTFEEYKTDLSTISSQETSAQSQMDTVVNQTYDEYQSGQINNTDLIDPYVLQNQYSPGSEFEGWAAATLAGLGTNQPTNLSQTGYMNVTLEDGTQLQGVVHSQENPPTGEFQVNETYNPDEINGTQYIVTDSSVRELKQNFTLDRIETTDGETVKNFTIEEKNYETTSSADLEALYNELATLRAAVNARQQALRSYGGGGGLFAGAGGLFGIGLTDAQAGAAIIALVVLGLVLLAKASD